MNNWQVKKNTHISDRIYRAVKGIKSEVGGIGRGRKRQKDFYEISLIVRKYAEKENLNYKNLLRIYMGNRNGNA